MTTAFERVMAAVELNVPDRVPVVPQITYTTAHLTGIKLVEAMYDSKKMADALLAGYKKFKYDGICVGWESSFNLVAEAIGCKLKVSEDGIPSVSEQLVKSKSDLDKIKPIDPRKSGRLHIHLEAIELVKKKVDDVPIFSYVPGPLTLAGLLRGTEKFLMEIITDKRFVHELVKKACEISEGFAVEKIRSGADVIVIADPTASGSIISKDMFLEFSLPYIRKIIKTIESENTIPSVHICGNTSAFLDEMTKSGARIFEVDHAVDLRKAKGVFNGKLCLEGNINPSGGFLLGTKEDIEKEVKNCIESAAEGGGYILSTGCEVGYKTPLENIKTLVDSAKRFGKYG